MIDILFFARIREQLGTATISVPASPGLTVAALRDQLIEQHGSQWEEVLCADNVIKAVNQEQADDDQPLVDGDEVAFFPPVTGG